MNKRILTLLLAAAFVFLCACGGDDSTVGDGTANEGGDTSETDADVEETTAPLFDPEYYDEGAEVTVDDNGLAMLGIFTAQLYGQQLDGTPSLRAKYKDASGREVLVCDLKLTDGSTVCLEFDADVGNNGNILLNEGVDEYGSQLRSDFIVGDIIAVGNAIDCPFTAEDYDAHAAGLAAALFGEGATAELAGAEIIGLRQRLVYNVSGADTASSVAFDGWMRNDAVYDAAAGAWKTATKTASGSFEAGAEVGGTLER